MDSRLAATDPPYERYPAALVIARDGHVIRQLEGDPFLWTWIFRADGRQVAYETGSLHFNLRCNLADVATGRRLKSVDCFHGVPAGAPDWEKALESAHTSSNGRRS